MPGIQLDMKNWYKAKEDVGLLVNTTTEIAGKEIANTWIRKTFPFVPLEHGQLQASPKAIMTNKNPLTMTVIYDAVDPEDDYHYAGIQEDAEKQLELYGREFIHPIKGSSPYLQRGVELTDELGLFQSAIFRALK